SVRTAHESLQSVGEPRTEIFAAGGFGRRLHEVWITQKSRNYVGVGIPRSCDRTTLIETHAGIQTPHEVIDQYDARSGIESAHTCNISARRHNCHIPDSTDVLKQAPLPAARVEQRVGDRNEWCSLATRRDVTNAKITDDIDAGALRNHRRFTHLPRRAPRRVPDGLPV